jgi:hypothetical protein
VRLELNEKNTDKLLQASGQVDASVSAIANLILASVDLLEAQRIVTLRLKVPSEGSGAAKLKRIQKTTTWRINFAELEAQAQKDATSKPTESL